MTYANKYIEGTLTALYGGLQVPVLNFFNFTTHTLGGLQVPVLV